MSYPVIQLASESALYKEDMGSKNKRWCRHPSDDRLWLFKYPRETAGEHWSEKIAAELGSLLNIACAYVQLAELGGARGSLTRNILANETEVLVHGNELLAGHVIGYDKTQMRGQNQHTWQHICAAIQTRCGEDVCQEILTAFAGYLVFDAWIGNTDRHHQNWGLLQISSGQNVRYEMCPSFDHASSLGRELTDLRRRSLLQNMEGYRNHPKARGAIYWEGEELHPLPCIELVRRITNLNPALTESWLMQLSSISSTSCATVIEAVSSDWMSDLAKEFALKLIDTNRAELITCLRN